MTFSKRRFCPAVSLSFSVALAAFGLSAHGWSQQRAASAGDVIASTAGSSAENSSEGRIGDGVIEARWPLRDGKPGALEVRDVRDGQVLRLIGPFKLALADGQVVDPAAMTLLEPARVEPLAANPDATVAAEKLPGTSVHYRLGDPGGRFHVDWAVVMRQNAHYVRQVLTITAGKADVAITRVSLIDATVIDAPGIKLTGTVKGTPLTAGELFPRI